MHLTVFSGLQMDGRHTQPQTPDGSRTYTQTIIHVAGDVGLFGDFKRFLPVLFSSGTLKEKSPRSWDGDWNFRKCLKLLEKVKASYYPPWNINMEPKNQQNHLPTNRFLGFNMLIFPGCILSWNYKQQLLNRLNIFKGKVISGKVTPLDPNFRAPKNILVFFSASSRFFLGSTQPFPIWFGFVHLITPWTYVQLSQ